MHRVKAQFARLEIDMATAPLRVLPGRGSIGTVLVLRSGGRHRKQGNNLGSWSGKAAGGP